MIPHFPYGYGNMLHLPLQAESLFVQLPQQFPAVRDGKQSLDFRKGKTIPFQPSNQKHGANLRVLVVPVSVYLIYSLGL